MPPRLHYFFLGGAAGFFAALAVSILRLTRVLYLTWLRRRFIFLVRRLSPRPMRVSLAGSYITSAALSTPRSGADRQGDDRLEHRGAGCPRRVAATAAAARRLAERDIDLRRDRPAR